MTNIIHGEIWSEDFSELNQLIVDFSSCVRYSFVRFQKDNLEFNDVRKSSKAMYASLNTRQISDAVQQAKGLHSRVKDGKVVFGGRKNWNDYRAGLITKQQFSDRKNNQIYLRGDATKTGNLNARIAGKKLRITVGKRKWVWWKSLKSSLTATRTRMSDLKESDVNIRSEGESPSGKTLYRQLLNRGRDISKNDEIHSSIIGYNFLQL